MESRGRVGSKLGRTGASARRAPHAIGEDVGALGKRATPAAPARARRSHTFAQSGARRPEGERTPARFVAGPGLRATGAARPLRGRRSRLARAAQAWPVAGALACARRVGRRLRSGRRGVAIGVGAPLALLLALLIWLLTGSYWQTRHLRIEGTSDPAILALAQAQRLTGCDAFRCDFSAARRAIAASTHVAQVSVQVVFPDTTLVRITPRQPVTLWRTEGQTWAIGADGVVIDSATRDTTLATPTAAAVDDPADLAFAGRPPSPGARIDPALVAMASQLRLSAAGAGVDPASLRYTADDGFTMQAQGGALVVFGAPSDAQATLQALSGSAPVSLVSLSAPTTPGQAARGAQAQAEEVGAILARLAQSGASATLIDVRWGGHPYYR